MSEVRLTQLVPAGGWARKLSAEGLVEVLDKVGSFSHPWVDSRVGPMEDAALLRPESGPPLVFTVDFITPIVDDPATFGAIAAANALSDVYAMGGEPQVALAVCGFPDDRVSLDVIAQIFQGGASKAAEAGCAIVGGHTVLDPELKYGLCVIGRLDGETDLAQTRARAGDRLVLTKPIGLGMAAQAIKKDRLSPQEQEEAVALMLHLNRGAKSAALRAGAHSATDVTGFGLLSHVHHMAAASGVGARLEAGAVPRLGYVDRLVDEALVPGGSRKNLAYVAPHTRFDAGLGEDERLVLADAQTSGGLVIAVPPERLDTLLAELGNEGTPSRAVIGELVDAPAGSLEVA